MQLQSCSRSRGQGRGRGGVRGRRGRGLALIEILVVLAIFAIVAGAVIAGTQQLPSAGLKRSATMITSAIKVAYTRSTATSHDLRLVMDLDKQRIWLEESDIPMLVQSKDKTGAAGADPATVAEQAAIAEGEQIIKGPPVPKPKFHPIASFGFGITDNAEPGSDVKQAKPLQRRIMFRSSQTTHDDKPRTSGRAYLYFWPGGRTELASIQLCIASARKADDEKTTCLEDEVLSILVAPLTGKVTIKDGAQELVIPTDDTQQSDRQDNGFF
jgi:general secretion pathway protein H